MINVFLFSIAGKKSNAKLNDLLHKLESSEYTPREDRRIITHTLKIANEGNYPSEDYYSQFYSTPNITYHTLAELSNYVNDTLDFYKQESIRKKVIEAVNDSNDSKSTIEAISKIVSDTPRDSSVTEQISTFTFGKSLERPITAGIKTGVTELDEITNGFQPATIATIAAFTGHGKSTFTNSIIFKNALDGKKCVLLSLELAPDLVWLQLEARYMYQVKGLQVSTQDLLFHKVSSDIQQKILDAEQDFINDFASNVIIIDEGFINKKIATDYKLFTSLIKEITDKWNGKLDILGVDHAGQFELLYPECGNQVIKALQSFSKTYESEEGAKPVVLMAVQCNRDGNAYAMKHDGKYNLQAIADLNEVERSSSYIVFMYTSDDSKIMQETKITLSKHRLGSVIPEPFVTTFRPEVLTVGESVEKISVDESEFNSGDFGGFGDLGGFDDF